MASFIIEQTETFEAWIKRLRRGDTLAAAAVLRRIDRMTRGNFGDHHSVGDGVSELRIDQGPGYRVYYTLRGGVVVILLCGGDKGSQTRDIRAAQAMAKGLT